jgi:hypothetical protein
MDVLSTRLALMLVAAVLGLITSQSRAQIAFGDDSSEWAFDGECDDPRFIGQGMADVLLGEDRFADATDCRALEEAGQIRLRHGDESVPGAVDFGADTSDWIFDGECDDPRFIGQGMAEVLLEEDRLADATDCKTLYESGYIRLRAEHERLLNLGGIPAIELSVGVTGEGQLEPGDETLTDGEYCDYFTFEGKAGALAVVMLRTSEFDSYLIVRGPDGEQIENDDYEGDVSRSVVTFPMQQSGTYTIGVTSFEAKETGRYSVLFEVQADAPAPVRRPPFGELGVRDTTREFPAGDVLLAGAR